MDAQQGDRSMDAAATQTLRPQPASLTSALLTNLPFLERFLAAVRPQATTQLRRRAKREREKERESEREKEKDTHTHTHTTHTTHTHKKG